MGNRKSALHGFNLLGVVGLVLAALAGCGEDGKTGPAGPTGASAPAAGTVVGVATMTQEELRTLTFSKADSKVDGVTINSKPVVRFTVKDSKGRGITGLENFWSKSSTATVQGYTNLAFALAKLVPGTNGSPSRWVSYIVTTVPTTTSTTVAPTRPTTDNTGVLTPLGNGSYSYEFYRDIAAAAGIVAGSTDTATNKKVDLGNVAYEPTLTHRLTIQIGGNVRGTGSNTSDGVTLLPGVPMQNPINLFYDFIPATGQVVSSSDETREIVNVSACFQCHGIFTWHGGDALDGTPGTRQDTRYCVVCHTDQRKYGRADSTTTATGYSGSTYRVNAEGYDANGTGETWGQSLGLMPRLIHRIHRGQGLTKTGYNYAGVEFNHVTYPQDVRNCRKCHTGNPDGDNFKNKPNRAACGACHDSVNFSAHPTSSPANRANDSSCANSGCHTPSAIESAHLTDNATTNNSSVPTGAVNFTYEISSVTVASGAQPVIKFRILKDGTPVTFDGTTSGTPAAGNVLNGYTGAPSFVIAYTMTQGGVTPAEYNNYRPGVTSGGQPQTVSLNNLTSTDTAWTFAPGTSYGALSARDASGYYTATITNVDRGFPAGSTMRAVALQGYFTQSAGTNGIAAATARHAISVVKGVTGDTARRAIVDNAKCANCHEWLELHGGNRVYETGVCVMCHNPNLTSSGRGAASATVLARLAIGDAANGDPAGTQEAALNAAGYTAADPSTYPEATNNFKNMIHGIHGSHKRTTPYRFVRDRGASGVYYYDWSEVTFPGILRNCETCHKAGSAGGYNVELPAGALPTTDITTDANATTTVTQDRASVPNASDLVTLPITAACVACHDSSLAKAHIAQNGGSISQLRSPASTVPEQCMVCHGPGRVAAIADVHAK